MKQYIDLVLHILENGEIKKNRTGVDTLSVFSWQSVFDLRKGFPILTTKKVNFDSAKAELLWFIKGSTNINELKAIYPTKIWDDWADEDGELGPIYGSRWRNWEYTKIFNQVDIEKYEIDGVDAQIPSDLKIGVIEECKIDQLSRAINDIKFNPDSRRIIVSAWDVPRLSDMRLPPCHVLFQFNVSGSYLDLQLYQRSADLPIGVPFNQASYALLLTMAAEECGLTARNFIHTFGDAHIYVNQIDGIKEQIKRECLELPTIRIAKKPFFDIGFNDIQLENYKSHPAIKFPIAV